MEGGKERKRRRERGEEEEDSRVGTEGKEKDRNAKWLYVGEFPGSSSTGQLRKRWIDTVKYC